MAKKNSNYEHNYKKNFDLAIKSIFQSERMITMIAFRERGLSRWIRSDLQQKREAQNFLTYLSLVKEKILKMWS